MKHCILIIGHEEDLVSSVETSGRNKYHIVSVSSEVQALEVVSKDEVHIVFLNLLGSATGAVELIRQIKEISPVTEILVLIDPSQRDVALEAIREGAYDFIVSPFESFRVKNLTQKISEGIVLKNEISYLKALNFEFEPEQVFAESDDMRQIVKVFKKMADNPNPVLIEGESGTGKGFFAKHIHFSGKRKLKPFVTLDAKHLSEGKLEIELFGMENNDGAGNGGVKGVLEKVGEGTVFLKEISVLSPVLQVKLLRFLKEKSFIRTGGGVPVCTNARIIMTTSVDLNEEVRKGNIRPEFYDFLKGISVEIPALRNRKDDIPLLARHFLSRYMSEFKKDVLGFSDQAFNLVLQYQWPGNIRELQNIIARAVVCTEKSEIQIQDLPMELMIPKMENTSACPSNRFDLLEKEFISHILNDCDWNPRRASELMGIHRNTLLYKMKKLKIQRDN